MPKNKSRRPTQAAQEAKFQRQSDLRSLQEADEIRGQPARLRGAKREAAEQQRALSRISKK